LRSAPQAHEVKDTAGMSRGCCCYDPRVRNTETKTFDSHLNWVPQAREVKNTVGMSCGSFVILTGRRRKRKQTCFLIHIATGAKLGEFPTSGDTSSASQDGQHTQHAARAMPGLRPSDAGLSAELHVSRRQSGLVARVSEVIESSSKWKGCRRWPRELCKRRL
jgi:hypothetical protein